MADAGNDSERKVLYLANPYGFSAQQDVRDADGVFAVVNGCPPDEGVMVELADPDKALAPWLSGDSGAATE